MAVETDEGETLRPLDVIASSRPNPEETLSTQEQLDAIYRFFETDEDAALVLEAIREGWSSMEAVERLSIPRNRYDAALRRIRYHVK